MKWLSVALVVITVNCLPVSSYGCDCYWCSDPLRRIDNLMVEESRYHQFSLPYGTEHKRVQHVLTALNNKISHSRNGYDFDCKQVEDEILAKSKLLGIEKIGLETNVIRLKKVLKYQDDRNQFYVDLQKKSLNETQSCVHRISELENTIESLNATYNEQVKKNKQQAEIIKSLEKDKKRLQVKLSNNAPSIHGGTGKIYPQVDSSPTTESDNHANSTARTATNTTPSTIEMTVRPVSINATTTESGQDDSSVPDIDLRNDVQNNQ